MCVCARACVCLCFFSMIDDYVAVLEIAHNDEYLRNYMDSIIRTNTKESVKYKLKIKQNRKVYESLLDIL